MAQQGEASVEEILDSIKKVIARDNLAWALEKRRQRQVLGVAEDTSEEAEDTGSPDYGFSDGDNSSFSDHEDEGDYAREDSAEPYIEEDAGEEHEEFVEAQFAQDEALAVDAALQPSDALEGADDEDDGLGSEAGAEGANGVLDLRAAALLAAVENRLGERKAAQRAAKDALDYGAQNADNDAKEIEEDEGISPAPDRGEADRPDRRKRAEPARASDDKSLSPATEDDSDMHIEARTLCSDRAAQRERSLDDDQHSAPLTSDAVRSAMQDSLAALAVAMEPPAQSQNAESGGHQETSLEAMVRAMLRPMLAEWLDTNLPAIVTDMVDAEIKRISGRE